METATAVKETTEQAAYLESWQDVNLLLKKMRETRDRIDTIKENANSRARDKYQAGDEIIAEAGRQMQPLEEEIHKNEKLIEQFTFAHKKELKGRTMKLQFGAVHLKKITEWIWPAMKDFKAFMEKLKKSKKFKKYIVPRETLNKQALIKDPAAEEVVKKKVYDKFRCEY